MPLAPASTFAISRDWRLSLTPAGDAIGTTAACKRALSFSRYAPEGIVTWHRHISAGGRFGHTDNRLLLRQALRIRRSPRIIPPQSQDVADATLTKVVQLSEPSPSPRRFSPDRPVK